MKDRPKSKRELIAEIGRVDPNLRPPFIWERDDINWITRFSSAIIIQKGLESYQDNYCPTDSNGIILSEKQWEEVKNCIDRFYQIAKKEDFDIDYRNLEQTVKQVREMHPSSQRSYPKKENTQNSGSVYLLKGNGYYKIGRAQDPINRTDTLTVKLPFEVELIHTVKSNQYSKLESFLHRKFSDKRVNGEWFDLNRDDINYIRNLNGDEYNE